MSEPSEEAAALQAEAAEAYRKHQEAQADGSARAEIVTRMIQVQRSANQRFSTPPEE